MKIGLVMEGGSMRGMYTAGVTDVMMENNISFDGAIGTSAGAAFGCNYKSNQPGRAIRYNKRFCKDKRYASMKNLITTGNLFSEEFAYHIIPNELDIFDRETFKNSSMEFYVTCTDIETGKAVYHRCDTADDHDLEWMRASASLPLAAKIVEIDGYKLLDGGMADSIPAEHFYNMGYKRNIVILTQPKGFVKEPNGAMAMIKLVYRKYPNLVNAIATRHIRYNQALRYVEEKEKTGEFLVIRPPEPLEIKPVCRDEQQLEMVYQTGRRIGEENIDKIKEFIKA